MKKRLLLFLPILIISITFLYGIKRNSPVRTIYHYQEALSELAYTDANTLIVFDIDDTITSSPDMFARMSYWPWWFKMRLAWSFPHFFNIEKREATLSVVWRQAPRMLIEDTIVTMIQDLQKKGCIVLGLTAMQTGGYGDISDFPQWRFEQLSKMGIVFTQRYDNKIFEELPTYRGNKPMLCGGILCTNQHDKGKVLAAFLDYAQIKPTKIISFDDNKNHLHSIGLLQKHYDIPCILFEYRGACLLPGTWNTRRALKQLKMVEHKKQWISDQHIDGIV